MSLRTQSLLQFKTWKFIVGILFLSSCGLKYTSTESPEEFEQKRRTSIENYIKNEVASEGAVYSSIAFGESQTVKPLSYRQLDSLYEIKYQNEGTIQSNKELEEKIQLQRIIAQNDTNKVLYIEDHIFSLTVGDTLEIYFALFQMKKDLIIEDMVINESVFIPKHYGELYAIYLFEESFLYPGNMATQDEVNFYTLYKQPLVAMSNAEQDIFILHTLKLMELAAKKNTLRTNNLLKMQATEKYLGKNVKDYTESFSDIKEMIEIDQLDKETVTGYEFDYSFSNKETKETTNYRLQFDSYLRLTKSIPF